MQDPILNRDLEETRELVIRWSQFHEFFRLGMKGENITPQAEFKFLELKTRIAMLHDGFLHAVQHNHKTAQSVIDVMASCIMLRRIKDFSPTDLRKLETDWNEAHLLMTETIAHLEERQQELLMVSEGAYKLGQLRKRFFRRAGRLATHPLFIIFAVIALFILAVVGLPALGVYDIRSIKREFPFTQPVYDPVVGALRTVFSDIPYASMAEVELADPRFGQVDSGAYNQLKGRLEPKDFINQLVNRGFDINDIERATRLFENRRSYSSQVYVDPEGNRMIAHEILFDTSEAAREFARLRRAGLDKMTDSEARYQVEQKYTLARRANLLVLLELSSNSYRRKFAEERWGFGGRQIGI